MDLYLQQMWIFFVEAHTMITLFLLLFLSGSQPLTDEIVWQPGVELTWNDFTRRTGVPELYKAFSHTGIRYEVTAPDGEVDISIIPFFSSAKSWVHVDFMNDNLLKHERGHFYITVIYAQLMEDALKEFEVDADMFMEGNLQVQVQEIFQAFYSEMDLAQGRYDKETEHGTNEEIQYKWDEWFKTKMARKQGE
jgi:hypothetical protein